MKLGRARKLTRQRLELTRWHSIWISVLALGMSALSADADTLYSNLGSAGDVYNVSTIYSICGTNACGYSSSVASLFSVSGTGMQSVTQIDLAVADSGTSDSFDASIWTDVAGAPGSQVPNAVWNDLPAVQIIGSCCDAIVTIPGSDISGVALTGGDQYFMVLSQNTAENNVDGWYGNSLGATGIVLTSQDGGAWQPIVSNPNSLAALDVLGTPIVSVPEPITLLLISIGIASLLATRRFGQSE